VSGSAAIPRVRRCRVGTSHLSFNNMERRSREGNKLHWRLSRIRLVAVVCLLSSCTTETHREPRVSRSIVADVILTIDNRTSRAVMIVLEAGTTRDSLGVVLSRSSRSFSMPSTASDSTLLLRFEARENHTGRGFRSEAFRLSSGHQAVWVIDRTRNDAVTMR